MKMVFGSINYLIFPEDNEIHFGQDFNFYIGVPSDRKFFFKKKLSEDRYCFVADEYGITSEMNIHGRYGNGAIFISKNDLPQEIIDWIAQAEPIEV